MVTNMIGKGEFESLMEVATWRPSEVAITAESLRHKSLQCADLASSSVTADARQVLSGMAADYEREAEQLEKAVEILQRLFPEKASN